MKGVHKDEAPQLIEIIVEELAYLPFFPEAARVVSAKYPSINLNELAEKTEYGNVFEAGVKRAEDAVIKGKIEKDKLPREPADKVLTYVIASIIIKLLQNNLLVKRYALAEARLTESYLYRKMHEDRLSAYTLIRTLYARLVGINIESTWSVIGSQLLEVAMDVKDYLKLASNINEPEWRLVNQAVTNGRVYLKLEQTIRLLRDPIAAYIEERIHNLNISKISERYIIESKKILQQLAEKSRTTLGIGTLTLTSESGKSAAESYPPCIKHLLERLNAGENLPHHARFLLATFFINIGVPIEEIVTIFSKLPDFDEKITRYQLEHISGMRGSGTKYMVPSCNKIASLGLCIPSDECKGISNPLTYFIRKRREESSVKRIARGKSRYGGKRKGIPEDEI
jgi:DNA primase large subunit